MEGWAEERKHYVGGQAVYDATYTTLPPSSAAGTCTLKVRARPYPLVRVRMAY